MVKQLLIFLTGAAIGSGVTYLIVDKKTKDKVKQLEDELNDITNKNLTGSTLSETLKKEETVEEKSPDVNKSGLPARVKVERVHYNDKFKAVEFEDGSIEVHEKVPERGGEEEEVKDMSRPYPITSDEYDSSNYEQLSFIYSMDGQLLDEDYMIVDDLEGTVGEDFTNHFGYDPEEPDIAYIRNEKIKTDFEICKMNVDSREMGAMRR